MCMRHFTKTILATVLLVLGVLNANAVKADLDPAMFKAWDGYGKDAKVVENPEECPNSDGTTSPFGCDYKLYETVGAGACVFGNTNVYYLWYADITGTKTITIEGTAGLQLRFLFNRPEPGTEEGADPHGGQSTELTITLDDNGQGQLDVSSMEYCHLNTVKLGWGSPEGVIRKLELEGSVKPVTGWVDMLNNGDLEGDDVSSFVVALDAVNDPGTYPATITDGVGRNGSRGIKVTSIDSPAETWATQFFLKMNELLPEGTEWRLSMDIKADHDADSGSGCHEAPRDYKSGTLFDPNPHFSTDWKTFEASGTLAQIGDNGLGSIAFDLNVDGTANNYYFDNISFQVFKASTPVSLIKTAYGADVVRVDFSKETNMQDLVKAAGGERVVYPNECAAVTVNGQPTTLMSVEARPDGYLWIFIDEGYPEGEGEDEVAVSFTNPTDADKQLIFKAGKYEGEPIPSFENLIAEFNFELSENYSYLYGAPAIVSADPEDGSFNLSQDMQEFKVTFDHNVDCAALNAKLDKETLTKTPADGFAKEITLTRGGGSLEARVYQLSLTNVKGEKDFGEAANYTLNLSFGPINIDPNDQPKDLIDPANFAECAGGGIPAGFVVTFGEEVRTSENSYGSGSRMFDFGEGGDFTKGLYFREGTVEYGSTEGFELTLEAGKNYNIHFNSAMWKDNGTQMTFELLNENDEAVISETIQNWPNVNGSYNAVMGSTSTDLKFSPETSGNYRMKWTSNGFVEVVLGNPGIRYIPNVLGIEDIQLVTNALESAKSTLTANSDSRYAGEAYNALDKTIKEYDGVTFTAPSVCKKAAAELEAAAKAMGDHRVLCDTYDPLGDQAQTIIDEKAETKFAKSPIYSDLKSVRAKYQGKVLTDDAELKTAVDELKEQIDFANAMFTEGASTTGMTGYAVLVDRIRMGAETLLALGAAEDDPAIIAANDALSDDDGIANWLTGRITLALYNDLKNGADSKLFQPLFNETIQEEETPTYDMTAFVKNPNIYKLKASNSDYTQENVPGWTIVDGKGLTTGWSQVGSDKIPADAMVSNWGGAFTVYQTVENLPAGVYTLKMGFGERDNEESAVGSYIYAKTSANTTDSVTVDCPVIGQAYPFKNVTIENLVVTDGILTFGVQAGASSHAFFNDVQILLTGPAAGFDYGKAYADAETGIDGTMIRPASVRSIELFDLNGRRVKATGKGIFIMRKQMDDGTIRTEKVVVK